jgi:D-beta-D-heptose 7-phosphate kinase/D-beta-D-heptose 1-phosphate adenosyltransferase
MAVLKSLVELKKLLIENGEDERPIYMTSGGFDPLHVGHLRCIQETSNIANDPLKNPSNLRGLVVVVVNADSFLMRKKGYAFMPLAERMEIIDGISGVDYVVPWEAEGKDQTVIGAIKELKPQYFTKGGDRFDPQTIPEWNICTEVGCKILTGVGSGGKIQSSSDLVRRAYGKIS